MSRSFMQRLPAIAAIACLTAAPATAKTKYVYGPAPDWDRYVELGTAAIRTVLPNPDDWQVLWPNGYKQAAWWPGGLERGYLSCGIVRAIKLVEGGYPSRPFIVVIDQDRVKKLDYRPNGHSLVAKACDALVKEGILPPASMMPASETFALASLGVTIRTVAAGASVVAVTPGSVAATGGVAPGTTIIKANGIPLADMGAAMAKVLESDAPVLRLDTAYGRSVEIKRPR